MPDSFGVLKCTCGGEARVISGGRVICSWKCANPELEGSEAEAAQDGATREDAPTRIVGESNASPARRRTPEPAHSPSVSPPHRARRYQHKRCPCGARFTPTGPRQVYCRPDCAARPAA